jgi:hypothetical protein
MRGMKTSLDRTRTAVALGSALAVALAAVAASAQTSRKAASFLDDAGPVVAAFKAKVPAGLLITELNLNPKSASWQTSDPKKKDTFDDYNFIDGKVSEPEPVQVFTVTCKKGFSIDEADFAAVPGMIKDAAARLNLEDGEVTHANLSRGVFCKEPRWIVFVNGKRKDGMVEYDPKGKFRNAKVM